MPWTGVNCFYRNSSAVIVILINIVSFFHPKVENATAMPYSEKPAWGGGKRVVGVARSQRPLHSFTELFAESLPCDRHL